MKKMFIRAALAAVVAILALACHAPAHGQVDKVKEKAKDLKKQVEGGKQSTNKPPQAPKPVK